MATLSQLIADVRSHLDEATAAQWSDAEITRWLNEGQRDVARRTEVLQATATIPVTAGQQNYVAPADMLRIHRVEHTNTGDPTIWALEYRDWHAMDQVWWSQQAVTQARPVWYTLWGFPPNVNIVLYPKPHTNGSLKVFYYKLPADLVNPTDTTQLPNGWDDLLVLWCEHVALRKDADPRWTEAKQLYEERLAALNDLSRRWTDAAGLITSAAGAYVPQWLWSDW